MRTFKWRNEDESFTIDDSTSSGKSTCEDLLANGAVEIKAPK